MGIYSSVVVICVSLLNLDAVPAMTKSLYIITFTYFIAYVITWCQVTVRFLFRKSFFGDVFLTNVNDIGIFCPMLAILVIEMWIHARNVTNAQGQYGVPQGYVQDATVIA